MLPKINKSRANNKFIFPPYDVHRKTRRIRHS